MFRFLENNEFGIILFNYLGNKLMVRGIVLQVKFLLCTQVGFHLRHCFLLGLGSSAYSCQNVYVNFSSR